MNDKTLTQRLDVLTKDDHERGCQGRFYSCTCGYDNDCSQAMQDAKSRIEALEAALRFYADWHPQPSEGPWGVNSRDFGDVAHKALEGSGND